MVWVAGWVELTRKKYKLGHKSTRFALDKKKKSSLDRVFFKSGRVGSENLTRFAMSTWTSTYSFQTNILNYPIKKKKSKLQSHKVFFPLLKVFFVFFFENALLKS